MFFTISKGIREFCDAMESSPDDWIQSEYEFINTKHRDLSVWTCNGLLFIAINGNKGLTLAEKVLVLKSVKLTAARKLKNTINHK